MDQILIFFTEAIFSVISFIAICKQSYCTNVLKFQIPSKFLQIYKDSYSISTLEKICPYNRLTEIILNKYPSSNRLSALSVSDSIS